MSPTIVLCVWLFAWSAAADRWLVAFDGGGLRPAVRNVLVALAVALIGASFWLLTTTRVEPAPLLAVTALLAVAWYCLCWFGWRSAARLGEREMSVRARLLLLSLVCVVVGAAPRWHAAAGSDWSEGLTFSVNLVLRGALVWCAARAFARRYVESLRRAISSLAEIERGNLDVRLDPRGSDEIAEMALALNHMVEQLKRVEFLEQLNDGLRSQAEELQRTLESLRAAQADLVRAERMASVATLVRGIAHELNNPIGYIAGNMPILKRYCDYIVTVAERLTENSSLQPAELRQLTQYSATKDLDFVCTDLERMSRDLTEGARRAQLIIGDLQSLTSAAQRHFEDVNVRRAIEHSVNMLSERLPVGATIELDLEDVPPLHVRAGQLEQVLVNLLDNARRAVGRDGRVRLSVRRVGAQVLLSVEDDGCGMTEEVRARALEPFFTTRGAGEGSGLGLAIAASIVRAHNGTLEIRSALGSGTRVDLRLPLPGETRA